MRVKRKRITPAAPCAPARDSGDARRIARLGPASIMASVNRRLRLVDEYSRKSAAEEIADKIVERAQEGDFEAVRYVTDKTTDRGISRDELRRECEKIFEIICRHVTDQPTRAAIARDLKLEADYVQQLASADQSGVDA